MKKKILHTLIFIIFRDSLMFYQVFFSPQVKRCAIITYKHGIYELPNELPKDLRLRKFSRHFRRWGGPKCPHKKKKKDLGN